MIKFYILHIYWGHYNTFYLLYQITSARKSNLVLILLHVIASITSQYNYLIATANFSNEKK